MRLLEGLQGAGRAMKAVALLAAGTIVLAASAGVKAVRALTNRAKELARSSVQRPIARLTVLFRAMQETNDGIDELEAKKKRDGHLGEYDRVELQTLYGKRTEITVDLSDAREMQLAEHVANEQHEFGNLHVTDRNLQVLQFHAGQTVYGKTCFGCGRPMVLQWQQRASVRSMSDFFWGCSGFYGGSCRQTEPFGVRDMSLFTKTDREEFSLEPPVLDRLAERDRAHVANRMKEVVGTENMTYCCPIHFEPMRLRRKNNAEGLLDLYFYSCPRWKADGTGCNYLQKLKSAAQLAAALETTTERGLL